MKNTILSKILKDNQQINILTQQIHQHEKLLKQTQDPTKQQQQQLANEITRLKTELQNNNNDKKRSDLIKEIEEFTGRRLLTYYSIHGMISDRDAHIIEDFLMSNNLNNALIIFLALAI